MTDVYAEIAQLESAKLAEETARREAEESALAKQAADQLRDQRLMELKAQAARQELKTALDRARSGADKDKRAVLDLRDALADLVSTIIDTLTPPLATAETAYISAARASQDAMAAGDALAAHAPITPPVDAATADLPWAAREAQIESSRTARAQARGQLPPLYTPDMAALIGMAAEKDDARRRVWAALHHVITGMPLVYTDDRYSAEDDARRRLRATNSPTGNHYA